LDERKPAEPRDCCSEGSIRNKAKKFGSLLKQVFEDLGAK
jgi:hypothetical protein